MCLTNQCKLMVRKLTDSSEAWRFLLNWEWDVGDFLCDSIAITFSGAGIAWHVTFSVTRIAWVVTFSGARIAWVVAFSGAGIAWVVAFSEWARSPWPSTDPTGNTGNTPTGETPTGNTPTSETPTGNTPTTDDRRSTESPGVVITIIVIEESVIVVKAVVVVEILSQGHANEGNKGYGGTGGEFHRDSKTVKALFENRKPYLRNTSWSFPYTRLVVS